MRPERFLILLCCIALAGSGTAVASTGFQVGATDDGNVADNALRPPLKRAWHRDLGASPGFPVIAGGRVFVIAGGTLHALDRATGRTLWRRAVAAPANGLAYDGGTLFVVTGRQHAQALDPATGTARWTARITDPTMFAGSPVAAGGRLYTLDDGFGSYLSAFDGATGARAFRVSASDAAGVPAVDAERIYLGDGRIEYAHAISGGQRLWSSPIDYYAGGKGPAGVHAGRVWTNRGEVRDAATGAKLRDYRSSQIPAFGDGLAVLADAGALVAVDEATGAQRWVTPVDGGVVSPPLVVGGTVFAVAGSGRLVSADLATGSTLGAIRLDAEWVGAERSASLGLGAGEGTLVVPVRDGVSAYVAAGAASEPGLPAPPVPPFVADPGSGADDDARAFQQDAAHTGFLASGGPAAPLRKRWEAELVAPLRALIADGKVFTVTPDSDAVYHLRAFAASDGSRLWRATVPQEPVWKPDVDIAYDAGRVFAVSAGKLRAFDAGTGAPLWVAGARVQTGPIAIAGLVYVGTDYQLLVFRESDGAVMWSANTGENPGPPASDGRSLWMGQLCGGWDGFDLATRTRIDGYTPCTGGGTGDPVAMADGLVANPDGLTVFRADSPDAAPVDGLRSEVVPAFAHGLRFTLDEGVLEAAPAAGGPLRWRFAGDGLAYAPPLVVGRQVFVFSRSGRLYALDADTGARLWSTVTAGPELVGPSLAAGEGLLLVPTRKRLVAYESAGGAPAGEDMVAPQTRVTPPPAVVDGRDPLLSFAADEDAFFSCKLESPGDAGPFGPQWVPCSPPHRLVGLVDGEHTFSVRATDVAGNVDETPAVATFTVDAAPDTRISGPPAETNDTRPSLRPSSADDSRATFECRFDGGAWFACTGFRPAAPLADGPHRFEARAIDAAGHADPTPAAYEWRQDTVAPTGLSVTSVVSNVSKPRLSGAGSRDADANPSVGVFFFQGESSDFPHEASFSTAVDASGNWSGAAKYELPDGTYRVEVRQGDRAGNKVIVTVTITVDAGVVTAKGVSPAVVSETPPELALLTPEDDLETATSPPRVTGVGGPAPVTVHVGGPASLTLTATPGADGRWSVDLPPLAAGHYEISALQADGANTFETPPRDLYVGVGRFPTPVAGSPGPAPGPVPTWESPAGPTPTATPTATATATATATPTATATATPTATATATVAATPTATVVATPIATAAATATPIALPAPTTPLTTPTRKIARTPTELAGEIRAGIRGRDPLPLRVTYDAPRPGTLIIRLRDSRTKRVVGSARATFRRAGVRVVTVRGRAVSRRVRVEVRFARLADVLMR